MATRRPLVLIAGVPQELPTTDVSVGPSVIAFFRADGSESAIPTNIELIPTTIRFVEADGTATWLPSNVGAGAMLTEASPAKSFFMAGW